MSSTEAINPVHTVQELNEQRGCPHAMLPAMEMGDTPVEEMTPDERKREYYHLLDGTLEQVLGHVHEFRRTFPEGIVERDKEGNVTSGLASMQQRIAPCVEKGDFEGAAYWTHDAIYRTIDIATEEWLAGVDTDSPAYQRINSLVDDDRQAAYGGVAIQKRVSSAANQTVHISCGIQRMTAHHFAQAKGRAITPSELRTIHDNNIRFAMPLTQLHLLETRPIRKVLGSSSLPGGMVEVYTQPEYFMLADGVMQFAGRRLVEKMVEFKGTFDDGRIGCPGAKYIPEIWQWTGDMTEKYASPALNNNANTGPNENGKRNEP